MHVGANLVDGFALDSEVGMANRAAQVSAWVDRAVVIDEPAPQDAGVPIDVGQLPVDTGVEPDAGLQPDTGSPDARPSPDAMGVRDAGVKADVLVLRARTPRPVNGGCGCGVDSGSQSGAPSASLGLMMLLGALMFRRRS